MTVADFHRHTDAIVEHFTPLIEAAMAELIPPEVIDQVLRAAYPGIDATKATTGNLPPISANQQAAVTAATAGLPAVAGAVGGAGLMATGGAVISAALGRALAMLASAPRLTNRLLKVIALLWAAAYLAGAREAADASDGQLPSWMTTLPEVPEDGWSPEDAAAALNLAHGDLATLLSELGIWIKEMSTTQVNRVGNALREADNIGEARSAIDAIVHDANRARVIAETEYARAQTMAARETYVRNGVPMVQWLHQAGACPACMENAAVSPIRVTERWPSGDVPVHPHCRCAEAPYFP